VTEEEYQRLCRALAEPASPPASDSETKEDVDEIVRALEGIPPIPADRALEDKLVAIVLREQAKDRPSSTFAQPVPGGAPMPPARGGRSRVKWLGASLGLAASIAILFGGLRWLLRGELSDVKDSQPPAASSGARKPADVEAILLPAPKENGLLKVTPRSRIRISVSVGNAMFTQGGGRPASRAFLQSKKPTEGSLLRLSISSVAKSASGDLQLDLELPDSPQPHAGLWTLIVAVAPSEAELPTGEVARIAARTGTPSGVPWKVASVNLEIRPL
jgi:hypothetical protein